MSPFHLQLQFCIALPEYLSLVVLAKKSTFKAVLSYSGIKNWHPTLSTRQPMQLVCSVRESTRDAVEGESLDGSPVPLAGWECWTLPASSSYTTFSFGEVNCGGKALFGDPAGDNREPPWGPTRHENLESLQPQSRCPRSAPHVPQSNS